MKLKLEKEMYSQGKTEGKSFTSLLHGMNGGAGEVEPDYYLESARKKRNNVQLSEKDFKLDAFELQLMEHGLTVSGAEASLVEDFYRTNDSRVLFPEFINRQVLLGMESGRNACQITDLVANTRDINSVSYDSISATLSSTQKGAYRVGESGSFPKIVLSFAERSIKLEKFGHEIDITAEVLRRMAIDQLAVHLQLIGARLRTDIVSWAIYVLINGDGNSNAAPVTTLSGLNYDGLITFDQDFEDFEPDVWIATKAGMAVILKLPEFKDPQAGFNYQQTGKMISPLGVTLRKASAVAADTLIGVDRSAALEMVREAGSQLTESDKIIDKQLARTVISQVAGFAKIYTNASRVWNYA